uniref:(northern house mosquito) hypothetical protein n=1 Tax=Culex pipiens TaxID=7175 RepID=A0A8D8E0V0_CULPI
MPAWRDCLMRPKCFWRSRRTPGGSTLWFCTRTEPIGARRTICRRSRCRVFWTWSSGVTNTTAASFRRRTRRRSSTSANPARRWPLPWRRASPSTSAAAY